MAKREWRFRYRAGRFFRRLVQGQARRAVSTRSPHCRSIRRKMACYLLPKTRRMFAFFLIVGQPRRLPNEFDGGLQLFVIPSREDAEGPHIRSWQQHKPVGVIHDFVRAPSPSLGMTELPRDDPHEIADRFFLRD